MLIALAAIHGTSLRGPERHGGLLAALRADGDCFILQGTAARSGGAPRCLTFLAASRFIQQILLGKEALFSRGKQKLFPTFKAGKRSIGVVHLGPFRPPESYVAAPLCVTTTLQHDSLFPARLRTLHTDTPSAWRLRSGQRPNPFFKDDLAYLVGVSLRTGLTSPARFE